MYFTTVALLLPFLLLAHIATCAQPEDESIVSNRLSPVSLNRLVNKNRFRPPANKRATSALRGPLYIELPLDHTNSSSETFLNRYWVDETFYKPGGPVFFIDNGEATAEGMEKYLVSGASGSLAERFNGLLILWEHRFYGTSLPAIPANFRFTPSQLYNYFRYHKIEQALEDVAVFARNFNSSFHPSATPWVFVGGSYPGARAAWSRLRNPEIFHASLASSAVVQLQENFWQYFLPVEKLMDEQGWGNCSSDIRSFNAWLNDAFDNEDATEIDNWLNMVTGPDDRSALYRYFHWDDMGDVWVDRSTNVRAAIGTIYQDFQYVGMGGYLGYFCDSLQQEAAGSLSNLSRNSAGVFQDYELNSALDIYATVIRDIWRSLLTPEEIPSPGLTTDNIVLGVECSGADKTWCEENLNAFSWQWQVCSEIGAFQVGNSSRPETLLPKIESMDSWIEDCVTYFGNGLRNGPNIAPINDRYGGWNMQPSNIMWNDGENDPWRGATPHSTTERAPKRPSTADIPANGTAPPGNEVFGYVVPGGFHCPDLGNVRVVRDTTRPPSGPVSGANIAHTVFINALAQWLPEFVEHDVPDVSKMPAGSAGGGASSTGSGGTGGSGDDGSSDSGTERRVIPVIWAVIAVTMALYMI